MKHYREHHDNMNLSDFLALDRTKLANERTYLGYIRTFISLLAAGVGLIRFVDIEIVKYIGIVLCFSSPLFFIVGNYRYLVMKREITVLEKNNI